MLHLKFIHLISLECLEKFPDISGAPNIERLDLSDCSSLAEVHESVGSLKRLVYLNMENCWKLKCLPSSLEMESLETLILSSCFYLERFPEISPCMVKLSHIDLQSCIRIKELPSSFICLSSLSFLNLTHCTSLENIPHTICKLQNLKSVDLTNCIKLQKWPEELGKMENLQVLRLGLVDKMISKFIKHPSFKSMFSLKILDLSYREIDVHNFPKDFHSLTSLEELYLTRNLQLIKLPSSISHLSHLKYLELNECYRLQTLHGLPSKVQVLMANNCSSLEKIEDLSEKYEWLHKIWLLGCEKLVQNQENEIYIDKMLHKSFLQKCASIDHRLSIAISSNKFPSWFIEQQYGDSITLKLPPKCHSRIKGFALCALFPVTIYIEDKYKRLGIEYLSPWITFTFKNGELISESTVNCINPSPTAKEGNVVWLSYIPISYFQQMNDNWSHINEAANLAIDVRFVIYVPSVLRCGAQIVYKEDVEHLQQFKTCVPDNYGKMERVTQSANGIIYEEKLC